MIHQQANIELQKQNTKAIQILEARVSSLEYGHALVGQYREVETTSFDGTLVWHITEFSHRRQEAINGRIPSIYSPPFYTSSAGYKMCLRIYLNGDGMGKGSHISLFFVIMRGQHDAILPWPFKQKVTLMLLDQNNREHVIDAFRPDPNSSSFKRPQSSMNEASGFPLFCSLSRLESTTGDLVLVENSTFKPLTKTVFVKDDQITVRCQVRIVEEQSRCTVTDNDQATRHRVRELERYMGQIMTSVDKNSKTTEKQKAPLEEIKQQVTSKKTFDIPDISQKYGDAVTEQHTMISLGEVNTDVQGEGYMLAVYFYPNGVGSSFGQAVAVGVAMKKSRLDAALVWPYTGKFTISMPAHDVQKSITPDRCLHGMCWERPETSTNKQHIIENFCPLDVLFNCEDDIALVRIDFYK